METKSFPNFPRMSERRAQPRKPNREGVPERTRRTQSMTALEARQLRPGGLSSARDRQRLRERTAAERERVERALASVPAPAEAPSSFLPRIRGEAEKTAGRGSRPTLRAVGQAGCPVCASGKVVADEVVQLGRLMLRECLHCDHRWTERPVERLRDLGKLMSRGRRSSSNGRRSVVAAGDGASLQIVAGG